jgi:hypothetical protein
MSVVMRIRAAELVTPLLRRFHGRNRAVNAGREIAGVASVRR